MKWKEPVGEITLEGLARAVVVSREDPLAEGRLAVWIPRLMPDVPLSGKREETMEANPVPPSGYDPGSDATPSDTVALVNCLWARPAAPFARDGAATSGSLAVPRRGEVVFVVFEDEDPRKPWWLPFGPVLTSDRLDMGFMADSADSVDDPVRRPNLRVDASLSNGNGMGWDENPDVNCWLVRFANGHQLRVRDSDDASLVEMATAGGHLVRLDDLEEWIEIRTANGNHAVLSDRTDTVSVKSNDKLVGRAGGDADVQAGGTLLLKSGGAMTIEAGGAMTIKADGVKVEGPSLFHEDKNVGKDHIHIGGLPLTGVPK